MRPQALGNESGGDGGDADVSPAFLGVRYELADDEWRKDSGGLDPMAGRAERGVGLVVRLPRGLSVLRSRWSVVSLSRVGHGARNCG